MADRWGRARRRRAAAGDLWDHARAPSGGAARAGPSATTPRCRSSRPAPEGGRWTRVRVCGARRSAVPSGPAAVAASARPVCAAARECPAGAAQRAQALPSAETRSVGSPRLGISPAGSQRRTASSSWRARGGPVFCRRPNRRLTAGGAAGTRNTGTAHDRGVQGGMTHVTTRHRTPLVTIERCGLEASGSRECPRLVLRRPLRRANVSSMTQVRSPPTATQVRPHRHSRRRLTSKADPPGAGAPVMRQATVRRLVHAHRAAGSRHSPPTTGAPRADDQPRPVAPRRWRTGGRKLTHHAHHRWGEGPAQ
jgi:hypothetical protein